MTTLYARFYKCDLQMQTPMDPLHWRGKPLPPGADEATIQQFAEEYVQRCYESGLEVIGITDHNFAPTPEKSFIPFLQRAIDRQATDRGYPITLFPGFEVRGPIGKGAHLVCLFEPGTTLRDIDATLTSIGLPPSKRFSASGEPLPVPAADQTFPRMLKAIQGNPSVRGICIGAHSNNDGVLDSNTVEQWWSSEVLSNEEFLCMELPRPREDYVGRADSPLIKSILLNQDSRYRRRHPIASVCSSDCKALLPVESDNRNYIGFRHTWIKMSRPSIEGLRQAFLDHGSRLRFGNIRPEDGYNYPTIRSISVVDAAFLSDQEIAFSPNMNTLIGGGGTGKSTIIEYLRIALCQEGVIHGDDARKNFEKLKKTACSGTRITVSIERDGARWSLQSLGGRPGVVVEGDQIPNIAKFFPVRFFSQREIYAIAEEPQARRQLIDNLIRDDLEGLGRRAEDLVLEIRQMESEILEEGKLKLRLSDLKTEQLDFSQKLKSLKRLEKPLKEWKELLAEKEVLDGIEVQAADLARRTRTDVKEWSPLDLPELDELDTTPRVELFRGVRRKAGELVEALIGSVMSSVAKFERDIHELLASKEIEDWRKEYSEAETRYEETRAKLQESDTDPEEYLNYEKELRSREGEAKRVEVKLRSVAELRVRRDGKLKELREIWEKETELRRAKAISLESAVPTTFAGNPFVEVRVVPYGDENAFLSSLGHYLKDARRFSEDDWKSLVKCVTGATPQGQSPTDTLLGWIESAREGKKPMGFPASLSDRHLKVLADWFDGVACAELRLVRVPDRVVVQLNRQDGSPAGQLEEGLSVGQKCTAILALLLAHDQAPAVIDQPEEELDNEFTYRELIPLLRRIKEERQLIVATHDPNLPVNGDAEFIYALEARSGRGVLKRIGGKEAAGALDRIEVREAVEEIMEGSEEAFRRRYDKYGF